MTGARNILINIRGSESLGIHAIDEANRAIPRRLIQMQTSSLDSLKIPTMGNTVQITVIATDFEDATTDYTSNIERRVVGGVVPETPDNTNNLLSRWDPI